MILRTDTPPGPTDALAQATMSLGRREAGAVTTEQAWRDRVELEGIKQLLAAIILRDGGELRVPNKFVLSVPVGVHIAQEYDMAKGETVYSLMEGPSDSAWD